MHLGKELQARADKLNKAHRAAAARRKTLTPKQKALVKNITKGMAVTDAAIRAGYSKNNASSCAKAALRGIQMRMPQIMDKLGLTDESLVRRFLKPALRAKETRFFSHKGKVVSERKVVAHGVRLEALDMAFRLKGSYAETGSARGVNVNVGVMWNGAAQPAWMPKAQELPAAEPEAIDADVEEEK